MAAAAPRSSTRNTLWIAAPPHSVYHAFTDPHGLAQWFAPGEMTAKVHNFDLQVGGGYEMSLYYPADEPSAPGKTAAREDRYTARFVALEPPRRIVEAIRFDAQDAAFSGEMIMEVTLEAAGGGTSVTVAFRDIPPGIRPEDNEAGTQMTLEKLRRYLGAQ